MGFKSIKNDMMVNPFLQHWKTPFETPPFHLIGTRHFKNAVAVAIKIATKELN